MRAPCRFESYLDYLKSQFVTSNQTKMDQEFKYLELVEVRNTSNAEWKRCVYLGTIQTPLGYRHYTMPKGEDESNYSGARPSWQAIRKIQEP